MYLSNNNNTNASSGSIYIQNAQLETGLLATDYLNSTSVTAKSGVLIDLPRINFDANGENGALLLEPSRQQLVPESEWFGTYSSNSNGTGSLPLVYTNNATSPDGYKNATKIVFDVGSGTTTGDESQIAKNIGGLTTGANYTLSFYAKGENGGEEIIARAVSGAYIKFTLTNEWKRYELTQSAASTSYAIWFGLRQGLGGIGTINSNATIWLWGVQEEAGSYATSYIPNHSGTGGVTRAADSCSVTGASDVIGQTEGTLFVDFTFNGNPTSVDYSIMILGSIGSNYITIGGYNTSLYARVFNTTMQGTINAFSMVAGTRYKVALAYANNDVVMYVNGVNEGSDTSASIPAVSQIGFTRPTYEASTDILNSQVYKERLTNAELATLTTL
tara:strand:- start:3 stop:1166 length:1164 start_codon:yes stop_codon:yes gene_type:complete